MRIVALLAVTLAFGCSKKPKPKPEESAPASGGSTNYQPGGGAMQNVRQPARRAVAMNDLHNLGLSVEMAYNETGKMPSAAEIKDLARQTPKLMAAIEDGSLVVTGTSEHGGVWAYETDAPEKGGLALIGPTPQRMDSLDLTNKLKQQ